MTDNCKQYLERDFLFAIVNTIDKNYIQESMTEIEISRAKKAAQGSKDYVRLTGIFAGS